jgi:flagellar basal-body rod protein FlgC
MLGVFSAMDIAASGLSAERTRMNTIASNLANAQTTRTAEGGPYRRVDPVFEAIALDKMRALSPSERSVSMVQVTEIVQDERPGHMVFSPGHPDANADGYLEYPNVNIVRCFRRTLRSHRRCCPAASLRQTRCLPQVRASSTWSCAPISVRNTPTI